MIDDERPTTLEEAARAEQACLWHDLDIAIRTAVGTDWLQQCEQLAWRIVNLAALVGATRQDQLPVSLLRAGIYERVLGEAGVDYEPIDWSQVPPTEAWAAAEGIKIH